MRLHTLVVFCCIQLVLVIFMIARQHNAYINPQKLLTISEDPTQAVNCKNFQGILDNTDSDHQSFTAEDPNCSKLKLPNVANLETDWLDVSRDDLVFVYSAYRETNGIRVIGAAVQSERQTLVLYCQIWARDLSYGVVLFHVKASIFLLPESHHLR